MNVEYSLAIGGPAQHLLDVTIDVTDIRTQYLDFVLPTWTPGSYLIREYSRHVEEFGASADGVATAWQKIDKQTWRVATGRSDQITVMYRVYANELTVRTNHVDDTHAHVVPAATFMYVDGAADQPTTITVHAPDAWNIATGLDRADDRTFSRSNVPTFVADNYDHLIDSPFEIGKHRTLTFDVDRKSHRIVIWGHGNEDEGRLVNDTRRIVEAARSFWGSLPYDHYTFFVMLAGKNAGGGLEHRNSTSLLLPRFTFQPQKSYERYLGLVSHEFFHVWNVKRLRAAGLGPFDYTREAYTTLLWAMEGITDYYTDLLLVRAGLLTPERYLERLADRIVTLQTTPGRTIHSLECASFDAWIKLYRPDENTVNTSVSYYLKGGVVATLLDLEIRRQTSNDHSLDDVMRYLYHAYPIDGPGIADRHGFIEAIKNVTGHNLNEFFNRYIAGTDELPYADLFSVAGLELTWDWKDTQNGEPKPTLGVRLVERSGQLMVANVLRDGPAYAAGLNADDEIVALNGYRVTDEAGLRTRLDDLHPGDIVTLTVFRREELRAIDVTLATAPYDKLTIQLIEEPSDVQQLIYNGWLGQ